MSQLTTTHREKLLKVNLLKAQKNKLFQELTRTHLGVQYLRAKADLFEAENELARIEDLIEESID